MKKLAILIYSFSSGGAERQVSILLKHLSSKYEITLILMNNTIFYEIPENVKVVLLENSNPVENGIKKLLKIPFLSLKYRQILKKNSIDISLSFLNRPNYINIIATKGIISERINPFEEYKTSSSKGLINRFLISSLYNKAKLVIPNSKGTEYDLNKSGIVNTKVIYNMLDIDKIEKLKNEKVDLKKEKFTYITVGRLEPQKNTSLLISAIKDIDAQLWIIGDGYLRKDLEEQVKKENLENRVKFLGRQKNPYKFLNIADCFVFPSTHEGFPNVLLEALACNLTVISTDCKSGPREILSPNSELTKQIDDIEMSKYGILTPVDNLEKMNKAMKIIKDNKNLREKYAQISVDRVKDFEVDKIINEWINTLDNLD